MKTRTLAIELQLPIPEQFAVVADQVAEARGVTTAELVTGLLAPTVEAIVGQLLLELHAEQRRMS